MCKYALRVRHKALPTPSGGLSRVCTMTLQNRVSDRLPAPLGVGEAAALLLVTPATTIRRHATRCSGLGSSFREHVTFVKHADVQYEKAVVGWFTRVCDASGGNCNSACMTSLWASSAQVGSSSICCCSAHLRRHD